MAYCERCGAYIPDGQSRCLACGFDPGAQNKNSSGGFAYERQSAQEEAQRKEAQRKEAERLRQEEERRQRQEEYRRDAEAEFARRQAQQREQERQAWNRASGGTHPYSQEGNVNSTAGQTPYRTTKKVNNKLMAALSYLGILFILPYVACPEDAFAKFHAKQGLALFIFEIVASFFGSVIGLGWLVKLSFLYLIYKGMTTALDGRMDELPFIGKYAGRID